MQNSPTNENTTLKETIEHLFQHLLSLDCRAVPSNRTVIARQHTDLVMTLTRDDPAVIDQLVLVHPPSQDHSRALQAAINRLPTDWRRWRGRPRRTWLRTIEADLQPTNLGLNSAWLRAQDRSKWRSVVETAMLTAGRAT